MPVMTPVLISWTTCNFYMLHLDLLEELMDKTLFMMSLEFLGQVCWEAVAEGCELS